MQFSQSSVPAHHFLTGFGSQVLRARGDLVAHCSDELVSALAKVLNEFWLVVPIAQHLADSQAVFLNEFRIDISLRPQRFQNLILSYEPPRVFHQLTQHSASLRRERHAPFPLPEALL